MRPAIPLELPPSSELWRDMDEFDDDDMELLIGNDVVPSGQVRKGKTTAQQTPKKGQAAGGFRQVLQELASSPSSANRTMKQSTMLGTKKAAGGDKHANLKASLFPSDEEDVVELDDLSAYSISRRKCVPEVQSSTPVIKRARVSATNSHRPGTETRKEEIDLVRSDDSYGDADLWEVPEPASKGRSPANVTSRGAVYALFQPRDRSASATSRGMASASKTASTSAVTLAPPAPRKIPRKSGGLLDQLDAVSEAAPIGGSSSKGKGKARVKSPASETPKSKSGKSSTRKTTPGSKSLGLKITRDRHTLTQMLGKKKRLESSGKGIGTSRGARLTTDNADLLEGIDFDEDVEPTYNAAARGRPRPESPPPDPRTLKPPPGLTETEMISYFASFSKPSGRARTVDQLSKRERQSYETISANTAELSTSQLEAMAEEAQQRHANQAAQNGKRRGGGKQFQKARRKKQWQEWGGVEAQNGGRGKSTWSGRRRGGGGRGRGGRGRGKGSKHSAAT